MDNAALNALLSRKETLESTLGRIEFWALIFGVIVVIGIAGESIFGVRAWWNHRKLHDVLDEIEQVRQAEIANLNTEAGNARMAAGKAEEAAAKANERAFQNEKDAAALRAEAARLNELAEDERLTRVQIEERIAPRQLTNPQRSALVDALKRSPTKGMVGLRCVVGDAEGFAFASQLDEALKAGGWPTTGVSQGAPGPGGNPVGLAIVVRSAAGAPLYATALQRGFKSAGMDLSVAAEPSMRQGDVALVIGNKPQ
jgi:hypothetical protein